MGYICEKFPFDNLSVVRSSAIGQGEAVQKRRHALIMEVPRANRGFCTSANSVGQPAWHTDIRKGLDSPITPAYCTPIKGWTAQ